ncbi:MAG: ThiF family adenylyltransferase [Proteobacteria bacterium]|nr:ThiF family adenylyltransferase [Pseudomonadota bacterium]
MLKDKRVAVVGCGSLGSEFVAMIAKAGVGNITIVDGESLAWANIGRHSLGASSVRLNKAVAMKSMLAATLPHVRVDAVDSRLGLQDEALVENIMSADIIVSATGSWSTASLLNAQWLVAGHAPDMIVTWMEAHAIAAHSVHLSKRHPSGCLQCGYSSTGTPRLEVTEWENDPTLRVPACGGVFMPYGPIGLSQSATLAAEDCVELLCGVEHSDNHRIWVGRRIQLEEAGGRFTDRWVAEMGDPDLGGLMCSRRWEADAGCDACGGSVR